MSLSTFRAGKGGDDVEVLRKHGRALGALRKALEKPKTAQAPETLCAVHMMMVNQVCLL